VWAFLIPDIFNNTFNQSEMESELDKLADRMKELKVEISDKEMVLIRQQVENQVISKLKGRLDRFKANSEKLNKLANQLKQEKAALKVFLEELRNIIES